MAMAVISLSGSVTVIHRCITRITIMATIRRGGRRIITTLIILPGGHTEVIAHIIILVATTIIGTVTVIGKTVMPGMTDMTGTMIPAKIMVTIVTIPSAVTRIVLAATIHP